MGYASCSPPPVMSLIYPARGTPMLTRTSRAILNKILELESESERRFQAHRIADLSELLNLDIHQALAACEELSREGYVQVGVLHLRNGQELPEFITLTELGASYKIHRRSPVIKFFLDNLLAFLSWLVAVAALLVSIFKK